MISDHTKDVPSIFLSHTHRDKEFVRRLGHDLESKGLRVWIDEVEILPGDSLISKIEAAIDDMKYLGVVLSPNSVDSEWVKREVRAALSHEIYSRTIKVIPILLADCDLPPFLRDKLYADFRDESNYAKSLDGLIRAVSRGAAPAPDINESSVLDDRISAASELKINNSLLSLQTMGPEELLAASLMVAFGFAFWQVNHLLHSQYGLAFSQVNADPLLLAKNIGEAKNDGYMGLAQFLGLAIGALPLFVFSRERKYIFIAGLLIWPLAVNLFLLGEWRHRPSIPGILFSEFQSAVLLVLVLVGSVRKDLIREFRAGGTHNPNLAALSDRLSRIWNAAVIGGLLCVLLMGVITTLLFISPDWMFTWKILPLERELLALLFVLSAIFMLCEAGFLLWRRFENLGAVLAPFRRGG